MVFSTIIFYLCFIKTDGIKIRSDFDLSLSFYDYSLSSPKGRGIIVSVHL